MNFSNRGNWFGDVCRLQLVIVGPLMVIGVYLIVGLHFYAYTCYISGLMFKRLGVWPAIGWQMIGLVLVFNISFNHFLAMIIKPGSVEDLQKIELMREQYKRR